MLGARRMIQNESWIMRRKGTPRGRPNSGPQSWRIYTIQYDKSKRNPTTNVKEVTKRIYGDCTQSAPGCGPGTAAPSALAAVTRWPWRNSTPQIASPFARCASRSETTALESSSRWPASTFPDRAGRFRRGKERRLSPQGRDKRRPLRVLASWLEGSLRYYRRRAPFHAERTTTCRPCANPLDFDFPVHRWHDSFLGFVALVLPALSARRRRCDLAFRERAF